MHGYYTRPQGASAGVLCETANQKPAVNSLECEIQNGIMHWGQLTMWMFHSLIIAWLKGTVYLLVRHTWSGLYPMQRADKLIKDRTQFWKDNLCKMQYTTWRRKKEIPRPPIGKTHLKVKLPSLNLQDFNDLDAESLDRQDPKACSDLCFSSQSPALCTLQKLRNLWEENKI